MTTPPSSLERRHFSPLIQGQCDDEFTHKSSPLLKSLLLNFRDLRTLNAAAAHQALLIENECVNVVFDRGRRERLTHALLDHDDARADANVPTALREASLG